MTSKLEKRKAIQRILGVEDDGIWGSLSQAALDAVKLDDGPIAAGRPGWDFINARIEGDDIVIDNAVVTVFGGADDVMDNGETASGFNTAQNPKFKGSALPMHRQASINLRGSPIPKLPWRTKVIFTNPKNGMKVETQLIDEGPARWTRHAGDMTVAAAKVFDRKATANNANIPRLNIRIVGGAKYVPVA